MKRRNFFKASVMSSVLIAANGISALGGERKEGTQFIINAGIGGNNTADLLNRIDRDCLTHRPELTIITVGTNDMNSRKFIPLDKFENNLEEIVSKLRKVGSQVVFLTLIPAYEPYLMTRHPKTFYEPEGYVARVNATNAVVKKMAKKKGVEVFDIGAIFNAVGMIGEDKLSLLQNEQNTSNKDGIHPTPDGYRLMATALYGFLQERGLIRNKIVCFGDSITFGDGGVEGKSYPAYLKRLLQY